jgi:hypothetical protein
LLSGLVIIGYIPQPGIVDVQYMAKSIKRNNGRGIIVFRNPPTYNVKIRALHGEVELVQAENIKARARELETEFKSRGYGVVVKDLTDVRNGMRDPM